MQLQMQVSGKPPRESGDQVNRLRWKVSYNVFATLMPMNKLESSSNDRCAPQAEDLGTLFGKGK